MASVFMSDIDVSTRFNDLRDIQGAEVRLNSDVGSPAPGFVGRQVLMQPTSQELGYRSPSPQQQFRTAMPAVGRPVSPTLASRSFVTTTRSMARQPQLQTLSGPSPAMNNCYSPFLEQRSLLPPPVRSSSPLLEQRSLLPAPERPVQSYSPLLEKRSLLPTTEKFAFSAEKPVQSFSPLLEQRSLLPAVEMPSLLLPAVEMPTLQNEPRDVTVIEKNFETQGMAAQEVQVMLQAERSRMSTTMQAIVAQQLETITELVKDETRKVANMVNSLSASSSERFAQLEAERSSRSGVIQGVLSDFNVVQSQIATLEQFRLKSSNALELASRERENVMSLLESTTKDVRKQHSVMLSGLASQKEQQQHAETALVGIRSDLETVIVETSGMRANLINSSQKEILAAQQDTQQRADNAIMELRRQMLQNLEAVRAEAASELLTLRQNTLSGLAERVRTLEGNHADQDVKDLARAVQNERSARSDLSQNFEVFRVAHIQTCSEMRAELDSLPEKMSSIARSINQDGNTRGRTTALEQGFSDFKSVVARQTSDTVKLGEATRSLQQHMQEIWQTVKAEQSVQSELTQMFESDRRGQIQTTSDMRADIQRMCDRIIELAKAPPTEDSYAREYCSKVEQALVDFRMAASQKISELGSMLGSLQAPEDVRQSLQAECGARVDLAQAVDTYRLSHLQSITDLRGDLDRSLEKITRLESLSYVQANTDWRGDLDKASERLKRLESAQPQGSTELRADLDQAFERLSRLESINLDLKAHLQASIELRGDLDRALEGLSRLESLDSAAIAAAYKVQPAPSSLGSLISDERAASSVSFGSPLRFGAVGNVLESVNTTASTASYKAQPAPNSSGSLNPDKRAVSNLRFSSPIQFKFDAGKNIDELLNAGRSGGLKTGW